MTDRHARGSRSLAAGDPLGAIQAVGGAEDAHSLAIRGIALAQFGEYADALEVLQRAADAFGAGGDAPDETFRARALAARAEVLVANRELGAAASELDATLRALRDEDDERNYAWLLLVRARLRVLSGDVPRAEADVDRALAVAHATDDPLIAATAELARAEAYARRLHASAALEAARSAAALARRAGNALLTREIEAHERGLHEPLARVVRGGEQERLSALGLDPLLNEARAPVVDALRRRWIAPGEHDTDLASRGVLFDLLSALARAWPDAVSAAALVRDLFDWNQVDDSHAARLKTALARLRRLLGDSAALQNDADGWRLALPGDGGPIVVLPLEGERTSLLEAFLWDGAAWSARSLAAATSVPQRTVQRELGTLVDAGRARALGGSRSMRYARQDPRIGFVPQVVRIGIAGW